MSDRPFRVLFPSLFFDETHTPRDYRPTGEIVLAVYPYVFDFIDGYDFSVTKVELPDGRRGFLQSENLRDNGTLGNGVEGPTLPDEGTAYYGPELPPIMEREGMGKTVLFAVLLALASLAAGCGARAKSLGSLASDAAACIPETVKAGLACIARKQMERPAEACPVPPEAP